MAGFRIDINDGRNAPVKPLEPPGGGQVPLSSGGQPNNEASAAQAVADVLTPGPHEGIESSYDPAARAVSLRVKPVPVLLDDREVEDWFPVPGERGASGPAGPEGPPGSGSGGGSVTALFEEHHEENTYILQSPASVTAAAALLAFVSMGTYIYDFPVWESFGGGFGAAFVKLDYV